MLWTEEAIRVLKRLALDGRSASVIALALGAASRSAVIGKANRIGVKLNGGGRGIAPGETPTGADRLRSPAIPCARPTATQQSSAPAHSRQPGDREKGKAAWTFAEAEVGEMRRLGFEEIRGFACRWPLGDPMSQDFAYCGLKPAKGRSYCAGHCRMAYRPPKARTGQGPRQRQSSRAPTSPWRLR